MIPTTKEIIYQHSQLCTGDVEKDMIEFAQLHVVAALKAASEKVAVGMVVDYGDIDAIRYAYPLANIV